MAISSRQAGARPRESRCRSRRRSGFGRAAPAGGAHARSPRPSGRAIEASRVDGDGRRSARSRCLPR